MARFSGQCKCGEIRYDVADEAKSVVNCHCNTCRSMNGGAFSTYVVVSSKDLSVARGRDRLSRYQVTENAAKHFCASCGTPIFNTNPAKYPGLAILHMGTLASHARLTPAANIFCESKLPWIDSIAEVRSFDRGPESDA